MINVFRKIWLFSGKEKGNLKSLYLQHLFMLCLTLFNLWQFIIC